MSIPVIAFFNNKGGVGKTSLVYHLAWMYSEMGKRVLAADLDPQANLTTVLLSEDRLEELFDKDPLSIYTFVRPLAKGTGDIASPIIESIYENSLALIPGDLALSSFEDDLSYAWPKCLDGDERSFRVISAFWRILQRAAAQQDANVILMDLGPNLGAINRAALISADYVVIPLSPDLYSLRGLYNLGPTLRRWRNEWQDRMQRNELTDLELPAGRMETTGYIVLQHALRLDRPVKAYDRWLQRIPGTYRSEVLHDGSEVNISVADDPHCLAMLKHYRSLMPLAQEARKPMFLLKPADGALGAHMQAVHSAYADFKKLAIRIAEKTAIAGLL